MPKKTVPKTRNGEQWTEARFNSFIRSALRRAQWPPRYQAIKNAYVKDGINPQTGRKCKLHKCIACNELFPQKDMQADHIEPVVPIEGFTDWNTFIKRLFVEVEGFQAVCKKCHKEITDKEKAQRAEYRRSK